MKRGHLVLMSVVAVALGAAYFVGIGATGERFKLLFRYAPEGKVWHAEVEKAASLYSWNHDVLFIGDSQIEQCEWHEIFPGFDVCNRGIAGEPSSGTFLRMLQLPENTTAKVVVLQTGINDLLYGKPTKEVVDNVAKIERICLERKILLLHVVPFYTRYQTETNDSVASLIGRYNTLPKTKNVRRLDLNPMLSKDKKLLPMFTCDGLHLNSAGYKLWAEQLRPIFRKWLPVFSEACKDTVAGRQLGMQPFGKPKSN